MHIHARTACQVTPLPPFARPPAGAEVPMPYAANLEVAALPQLDEITKAVRTVLGK